MMKKTITTICLIGSLLIILDSFNAFHSLILFVLFGIIPGTTLVIAPTDMMAAIATAITVIIVRITLWTHIRTLFESTLPQQTSRSKKASSHTA